jgi:hypothetical protein
VLTTGKGGTSVLPSPSGSHMAILLGSGKLAVREVASGADVFCAGPFINKCAAPYSLTLQLNGNMVFSGKNGLSLWSAQSGCVSGQKAGCSSACACSCRAAPGIASCSLHAARQPWLRPHRLAPRPA